MIRGNEEYSLLKNGLAPVLHEINDLVEAKVIDVNGELVELTIYLGGDYKVSIYWLTIMYIQCIHCSSYYLLLD